jgi:lysozyme family protein
MPTSKQKIIDTTIKVEGGYVNDPSDSGGETNFGITKAVARECGFTLDMKLMTYDEAFKIYVKKYWDALSLDAICELAPAVAEELFDTGVNMGIDRAGKFLQRCLNALNGGAEDLTVDGKIGAKSVSTLKSFLDKRGLEGEGVLFNMLNALQGEFYVSLCEQRPKDKKFIYGWFKNRVRLK